MNIERLRQIEKDADVKSKYLGSSVWGTNNVMYIPVIFLIFSIVYFAGYAYFISKDLPWQTNVIHLGCSFLGIIVFGLWSRRVNRRIRKENQDKILDFPVCLGKIVMGNDDKHIYYCIYTTGEKRLDPDWLDLINYKIWHLDEQPDERICRKINSIFKPTSLATTTAESTLLPLEFTDGEPVYKKIFSSQPAKDALVKQNDEFFPVIVFNKISVPLIREEDYMD